MLWSFVWDETKFERDGAIWREPVEKLIPVQVHPTNLTKTTKVGALLPKVI